MTRTRAITGAITLFTALAFAACGPTDPPKDEPDEPAKATEPEKKPETEKKTVTAPAPEPLPAEWAALVEALADGDRPAIPEGKTPALAGSGEGELTLPLPGAPADGETHTRHGWNMPDGQGSAIGVVRWTDTSWSSVKIDVGVGICPHRGRRLVSDVSGTGTAVAHHAATDPADDPNWFIHVNADANLADKAGETLSYVWVVFSY